MKRLPKARKVKRETKLPKKEVSQAVQEKARERKEKAGEEEKIMMDITWVAILVLVAFIAGFFVRGLFASPSQETPIPESSSFQGIAPPIPANVTTLPPGHPPIPGMTPQAGVTKTSPTK